MGYVDGTLADPCVCYDSHSHVNKSKGTHQLVVGGIIASATKEEGKKTISLSLSPKARKYKGDGILVHMSSHRTFLGA